MSYGFEDAAVVAGDVRVDYSMTDYSMIDYCKESTLSDNIWWHQPWRQGVPRSAILEEGGGVDSTGF